MKQNRFYKRVSWDYLSDDISRYFGGMRFIPDDKQLS